MAEAGGVSSSQAGFRLPENVAGRHTPTPQQSSPSDGAVRQKLAKGRVSALSLKAHKPK